MKLKALSAMAGLFFAFAFVSAPEAVGCVTCTSEQGCEQGGSGTECTIFEYEEELWCNYDPGACGNAMVTPLELSPAGTFLASRTVEVEGLAVAPCNGYIVAHLGASSTPEVQDLKQIRI